MRDRDYWIPAFAGMTSSCALTSLFQPGNDELVGLYTRIGIST